MQRDDDNGGESPAQGHGASPEPDRDRLETRVLLQICQRGDADALDRLARRFYPAVSRMVRARMGPRLRAKEGLEDIVHDVFVRLLTSLDNYEPRSDARFVTYLAKIVHRTVATRAERDRTLKRDVDREVPIDRKVNATDSSTFGQQLVGQSVSVREVVAGREMEAIVDECVAALDDDQREVILLRDYACSSWEDVGAELGRSAEAARKLHQRARANLIDAVKQRM